MPINNLISWKSTTHQEMMSMTEQLQMLNFELQAAQQEDEGATYRIEELERYQTMSNEAASHLEFKYPRLRSEFDEQMGQANAIMVHVGTDANAHVNQTQTGTGKRRDECQARSSSSRLC